MSEKIPDMLVNAWSVKTPREEKLVEQIAPVERAFLIKYAEYLSEVYCGKEFDPKTKEIVINDIIATAFTRIAALSKEVNPSLTHAVMAVVLYLLSNILTNEHVKYKTQGEMLAVYPSFSDRPEAEKENLFLTANWMGILFRVLPAKKNKGIAMDIIPKFVGKFECVPCLCCVTCVMFILCCKCSLRRRQLLYGNARLVTLLCLYLSVVMPSQRETVRTM